MNRSRTFTIEYDDDGDPHFPADWVEAAGREIRAEEIRENNIFPTPDFADLPQNRRDRYLWTGWSALEGLFRHLDQDDQSGVAPDAPGGTTDDAIAATNAFLRGGRSVAEIADAPGGGEEGR